MNKILAAALIAAALSGNCFAEDRYRTSTENGKQRIDFSLNGNQRCVILDDKISCQPMPENLRVASSETR